MRVRKDQRGFTIVELLIAIAILSIVVAAVCGFILVGSRSYATANSDINVQQSAQLSLNQMSDVMIDTTRSVNYVGYDAGGNPTLALKDSEFTFTPEDKSLIMYNGVVEETPSAVPGGTSTKTVDPGNGNKHYHFYWNKASETLYYSQLDVQPGDVDTSAIAFPTFDPADPIGAGWVELATHVTDFSVDLTQVEEKRVVMLALSFLDGKKLYTTSNNVTIRNKIGVNDAEIEPLNRRKTLSITPRDAGVILEPGETYHFSVPKVTGENVADKSVKWSVVSASSSGTYFTDVANGILQVGTDEPAGTIQVMITSNATDETGAPLAISSPITVYIKRVRTVSLSKTADADATNAANQVSVGSEFTISALVEGEKLGVQCNGCTADISHDFDVVNWRVTQGDAFLDIVDAGDCKKDTKYCVKTGTPEGTVIKIAATSELGLPTSRLYPAVDGEITLTVAKSKNPALPLTGGKLTYGSKEDDLVHNELQSDPDKGELRRDGEKLITAIRVVDNNNPGIENHKLILFDQGGRDTRVWVDLFDLDLNGSYTFYIQVLDVAQRNGNEDTYDRIWKEYLKDTSETVPYDYHGTRYDYRSVRYALLDKPKATYTYDGVKYTGQEFTLRPIDIYLDNTMLMDRLKADEDGYIQVNGNEVMNNMKYSIYKGEGSDRSTWERLAYFDEDSLSYKKGESNLISRIDSGSATLGTDVTIGLGREFFMQSGNGGNREQLCGTYHVVPGITYRNKKDGEERVIGWQGFPECPYTSAGGFHLTRKEKYYEFDESTFHVELTDKYTMDIKHDNFTGRVMFPKPEEMRTSWRFPNMMSTEEQTTTAPLTVMAKRGNNNWTENLTFTYVKYHYVADEKTWVVEPVTFEYRQGETEVLVHSYGKYKWDQEEEKWICFQAGTTKKRPFTIQQFEFNGSTYRTDFPIPTDSDFPFKSGEGETRRTLELYDSNMNQANNVPVFTVSCKKNGEAYEIEFRTEEGAPSWEPNNHQITVHHYGTYTWSPSSGQNGWTRTKGNYTDYKTNYVTNLEGAVVNGTSYKMYFPLPSESSFPFKGGATKINCSNVAYAVTDIYCKSADYTLQQQADIEYTHSGNTHRITFVNRWNGSQKYGTFECTDGGTGWTKVN
ncbi:prepilin-type N-terminal cleavage/methylation domain-containing protein [bacterium 1xD42-87]|nr:prepilin-type N-terminal cleavage/methylation domain-containing protein [bacterium 1xD42-87]